MFDDKYLDKIRNVINKITKIYEQEFGDENGEIQFACISFINVMLIINFISIGIPKPKINEYLEEQHKYLKEYFMEKENDKNH